MPQNKVVIITGASSGIGDATARQFGRQGATVVLAARRKERLESLASIINQMDGAAALPVATDVSQQTSVQALVDATLAEYGRVDVLVNNAGFGRMDWLEKLSPAKDIDRQVQVNLLGAIYTAQAVLSPMMVQRSGHIINVASVAGMVATPTYSVYAACKFGLRGFGEALRREAAVWGVHVSTLFPGTVQTEFASHTGANRKTGTQMPARLILTADDVANVIVGLVRRPRREVILPWTLRPMMALNRLLPGLVDWIIRQQFVLPERKDELTP